VPAGLVPPAATGLAAGDQARLGRSSAVHLAALSLDVHVEATLMVLRGLATAEANASETGAKRWRSWLVEDVELSVDLASALLAARGRLPASLPGGGAHLSEADVTAQLRGHYEVLTLMVGDLVEQCAQSCGVQTVLRRVVARCRERLAELPELPPATS
jgi:hypothetical protein